MDNFKIGARELSEKEAKLILPTYDKIFSEIEGMRNYTINEGTNIQNDVQKTNNIGILGRRGAGKTSLLKTIMRKLEKDNKNDILLPIIIPENMSTSSTLMATILGLFKKKVDDICKDEERKANKNIDCIHRQESTLKIKYIEVIKRYTFIQKEYRDILINEFTTENEYVKKSNEIFNSDIEFITKFNEFLKELLREQKNGDNRNPLIFIFIDDIDLSTNRCSDVIKTLLSYTSHPGIVSFISGDLDTFEEALTIDFLRKENAFYSYAWRGKFVGNTTLIDSKKTLSYEYLKKVIPPVYRHTIKHWSLEERGDYCVESENGKEQDNNPTLSRLLSKILKKHSALFKYTDYENSSQGIEKNNIYTYHLFDDTSRGLNNVYNVLMSIYDKMQKDDSINFKISFSDKKALIETIVASKETYNKYRKNLFEKIINFGINEETTLIRFDNLKSLYENDKDNKISKVEKFQLFVLVDFTYKLVKDNEADSKIDNENYKNLKILMINTLVHYPEISGVSYNIKNKVELKIEKIDESNPLIVIINFLLKSEWELALIFYKYLTLNSYEIFSEEDDKLNLNQKQKLFEDYLWKLYLSLKSCSLQKNMEVVDYIANMYDDFTSEFAYIQSSLTSDEIRKTVEIIYRDLLGSLENPNKEKYERDEITIMRNLLYEILKDKIFAPDKKIKMIKDDMYKNEDILNNDKESDIRRFEIIYSINKKGLWNHEVCEGVKNYICNRISEFINSFMKRLWNNNISINIIGFKKTVWNEFYNIYKGVSITIAKKVEYEIKPIIDKGDTIDLHSWKSIKNEIYRLASNNRVTYGQYEAQKMLNYWITLYPAYESEEVNEDIIKLLHYYAIYTVKEKEMDPIYLQSAQLSEFIANISSSQKKVNMHMINNFIDELKTDLGEDISIEEINKLFEWSNKNVE